jgi:hypothetical protein
MSGPTSIERRALTQAELELVQQTHYPEISDLPRDALADAARRLREYRNKARDRARQQRREMRGKAPARGAAPAGDDSGQALKTEILTGALKRVNRERGRLDRAAAPADQTDASRRALELKRANRARHHPRAGRTAGQGMRPVPNPDLGADANPLEVGRVTEADKATAREHG